MSQVRPGEDRGCTVAELIAHLQTMPPDARVTYDCFSETQPLRVDQVCLHRADEPPLVVGPPEHQTIIDRRLVFRNGIYVRYEPRHWPEGAEPEFATVVCFPGN